MVDQKIPELKEIREKIATVEQRAKIYVKDYLGFGPLNKPIQTKTYPDYKYYGEFNADGEEHGRGIQIQNGEGDIHIGYFKNGSMSTGNYIMIFKDDRVQFEVGEYYFVRRIRGTEYLSDGTEQKFDRKL